VTARTLELDRAVRGHYLALAESGALVGSVQVRNLATLGGNLCNAAPSADMAPPLLSLDAEAVITGPKGERRVPIAAFFTGVRRTVLAPDELLVELAVPNPGPRSGGNYVRHTPRRELGHRRRRRRLAAHARKQWRVHEGADLAGRGGAGATPRDGGRASAGGPARDTGTHRARSRPGGRGGEADQRSARLRRLSVAISFASSLAAP
jgi:hypothetical protein